MAEPKEWFTANLKEKNSTVTCTVQDGPLTAKSTVGTYRDNTSVKASARRAKQQAHATLAALREVSGE